MTSIYNLTYDKLSQFLVANQKKTYLVNQIFDWTYTKNINDFDECSNLSKETIIWLKENFSFNKPKILKTSIDSLDETVKFLLELDGGHIVETVLMKFPYGYSICVTTQVGCNMGCHFCASGLIKKVRNLDVGEIIGQIMIGNQWLDEKKKAKISRIVVMGIGEPLDNYDNLLEFLDIANHPKGLNISQRHITVSTCGIVPKIKEWARLKKQYNLAISLHASNDEIRSQIMPINYAYPMKDLLEAIDYYLSLNNRRITIEYILLDKINDQDHHALELVALFKNRLTYINLIPYNQVDEMPQFKKSENVKRFYDVLRKNKITATIRQERGTTIDAACGQLRYKKIKEDKWN